MSDSITANEDSAVQRLRERGHAALAEYFGEHREQLKKAVDAKIDMRIKGRMDGSDIVQETFVEASKRLDEYLAAPSMPLFDWLRLLAKQNVQARHREHFGTQKRNPEREERLAGDAADVLAEQLAESMVSPHSAIVRADLLSHIRRLIDQLSDNDKEILTKVHIDLMALPQVAELLGLPEETIRKRHFRAIGRLRKLVSSLEEEAN